MKEERPRPIFNHLQEVSEHLPAYYTSMKPVARSEQVRRVTYIQGPVEVLECTPFHRPVSTIIIPADEQP